jgi:hypothetical protein
MMTPAARNVDINTSISPPPQSNEGPKETVLLQAFPQILASNAAVNASYELRQNAAAQ